ncbi:MAG: XkdX family protein [Limosilactobacillus sp.]|nr:XkdX family protein [Limosilactobacillus sp.]
MVDVVQVNYEKGWFTKEDVALMVPFYITKDDYKSIVGEPYPEPETKLAEPATATDAPQG